MERLSHNHAEDTSELLSAYVDSALDVPEQRRAEAQVRDCPGCAQEVRDLRVFKTLLQDLPAMQPRRSFTLDPATAIGPRRLLFPTLRLATLVASLLFFVVLGVDVLSLGGRGASAPSASQTREAPAGSERDAFKLDQSGGGAPESAELAAASAAASTAPAPDGGAAGGAAPADPAAPAGAVTAASAAPAAAMPAPPQAATQPESSAAAQTMAEAPTTLTDTGAANSAPAASGEPAPPADAQSQADALSAAAPSEQAASASAAPVFRADQPSSPDTIGVQQNAAPAADGAARGALRIAEIGLGLIALALGAAALWAWRQQR